MSSIEVLMSSIEVLMSSIEVLTIRLLGRAEFSGVCPRSLVMHKLEKVWIVIVWNIGTDVDILHHVAGDRK